MGSEGAGLESSVVPDILESASINSFNIKVSREGPQLSTWPQGSTPVHTVIKYLEAVENSGQDLRYSRPWATSLGG